MSDEEAPSGTEFDIAVVGMAGHFPGAPDVEAFWRNLRDGVESIVGYSAEDLKAVGVPSSLTTHHDYVRRGAPLEEHAGFDAGFFGFNAKDAAIFDPQHRHFLECSWTALEHAGHAPGGFDGTIGVFAGSGMHAYMMFNLVSNPDLVESAGLFLLRHTGNDKDFLATRVSYELNLTGPSLNVQTACSTSLVATHLACQSLLNRECDMALAGGVTIEVPHRRGYLFREGEILSSDGRCRAFDQDADGTVFGSGVGVVVLRRLDDALRDGDCVHAVIKGSAVNNDGSNKVSYLAPSVDGQAAAIAQALAVAGVHPDDITYVEAHGTGTAMGDPIEIAALTQAFRTETARKGFCAVGSVKSNIGHTDTAAGVASLIKVIQALRHGQLPASLHVDRPNPACHFEDTPFHVNAALSDWTTGGKLRRALVSSLGVGGTNAHVVVEQAPAPATSGPSRAWQLLPLSAKTPAALEHATANLITHLKANPGLSLADAAFTYQLGRSPFSERRAVVCRDVADAIFALEGSGPRRVHSATVPDGPGSVAFMFSGQGAQHVDMGLELYEREPVFREAVDRCAEILKPLMDRDLREILYPGQADADASARALRQTQLTQPTLFTIEYALARLWASWGIRPRALIGHSVGEFVAACLAEVFSLEDGLSLVAKRGYLMQGLPSGAMLSVGLPAARVEARLGPDMSLAAINGPHLCVVAGSDAAIARLETELEAEDVACRRLSTSHAFHSAMMEPVVGPFAEVVSGVRLSPPRVPIVSTLTGAWMTPGQAVDPMYWARHLREPVRFGEAIAVLLDDPDRVLLEVGPGRTLTTLAGMSLAKQPRHSVVGSLRHPDEAGSDVAAMLDALGQLWLAGVEVEWSGLHAGERRQRVPLPTYPFEHQDYWVEPGEQAYREGLTEGDRREDIGDWFAQPSWRRSVLPSRAVDMGKGLAGRRLLVLGRNTAFDRRLVALAREQGAEVAVATPGEQFASIGEDAYLIRPSSPRDHERLIDRVAGPQAALDGIVHLWSLTDDPEPARPVEAYERLGDPSFFSLLCLAQAIGSQGLPGPLRLTVVSNGLHEIGTDGPVSPVKALLAGPCRVIPQELPDVTCSSVDVAWPGSDPEQIDCVADRVLRELASDTDDAVVAHRGRDRLVQGFDAIRLEPPRPEEVRVRPGGVYLITGGTGGLGLAVASYLARTAAGVKLVLVSRSRVPGSDATRAGGLAAVQALEEAGAEVLVQRADVTDLDQMTRVIAEARQRFGEIDGVVQAAGVLDDGPIQLKTRKAAERVLAPKVVGTLVLEEALAGRALDFLLLFSSVSAFAGMAGQVDYAASNAFLDAYARYRSARDGTLAVAVNWPAWRQVGMAARLAGGSTIESSTWRPTAHPLLARCLEESESRRIYATDFVVSDQWVLREHRMRSGDCLIPGAGFLELATAAYTDGAGDRVVELRGVYFMVPFVVADDQHRELRVQLDYEGTDAEFVITSGRDGSTEHVRGTITEVDVEPLERRSVAALMRRCSLREETFSGPMRHPQLEFGPRWGCLTRINFGDQEALLTLSLSPEFLSDLDDYRLHPAMLDVATAGAQSLIADFDAETQFFVPVGCTRLRSTGSLPARVYSHVRLRSDTEDHDLAVFDVTVMDEDGVELIRIDEFTMTRVAGPSTLGETVPDGGAARSRDATHAQPPAATAAIERALRVGVDTEEGVEALNRILGANTPPQVVVSPYPLDRLFEALQAPSAEEVAEPITRAGSQSDDQAPGDSHLAAPRTEVESLIARLWQDALGLGQVGVNDNFFGLGGHSLIAIRVSSRLRKAFKVDVPLRVVFDRPTVADLARFIEAATGLGNPVGTLTAGIDDGHPDDLALSPIPIQSRDATLRPSFAQEQVWFLDQLDPGNPAYSLPEALRLRGRLDVGALERSLSEIVRRHEVLRTRFRLDGTGPVLVIAPQAEAVLAVEDLGGVPESDRYDEAIRRVTQESRRAFDLIRDSLFRARLLRLADDEHILVITKHHITSDWWSWGVLYRELTELYRAFSAGKPSPLPPLPVQYADVAAWQRASLRDETLAAELHYWRGALEGGPTTLELPTDRPRPPAQTFRGERKVLVLPTQLSKELRALSRREGVILFATLLAAFQILLFRLTGQEDLVVGTPTTNRSQIETEGLIGLFVNTVVVRGLLDGSRTFRSFLKDVRNAALAAFDHKDVPFNQVVRALGLKSDPSRNPLFQVMFALGPAMPRAELVGVEVVPLQVHAGGSQVDLTLFMEDLDDGISGIIEYNTDLFDADTISRFGGHFLTLLTGIVESPGAAISALPVLNESERRQLLVDWNATDRELPASACVHQLFERQCARTPEAVAVCFEETRLTYSELDRRANQLAAYLREVGLGEGEIVGLCVERSAEMLVGLLGILKAGAAYLPLDPAFPAERLRFMLEDAQVSLLVTERALVEDPAEPRATVLCLDADWGAIGQQSPLKPAERAGGGDLAYVIYTSGSTGTPKGVEVPHRAVVNFLTSMRDTPGMTDADTLLAVTTLSFDIAALELYLPLLVGGRVVVASREAAADGVELQVLLAESGATVMQATPATWRLLLETGWTPGPGLRILCGGEAFPRDLANRLAAGGAEVWNLYGPTETTVWSVVERVAVGDQPVPIGRPIANTQIYLLDEYLEPVPVGVPGELYIGGDGLARGYRNRPALTAEKFVLDPFSRRPGARLYRTGDLARYLPDGRIECLGRRDHQVKVRGFRIELGEIETVLTGHPSVSEATVTVHEDETGDRRLATYVVYAEGQPETTGSELRRYCKTKLPPYMVPSLVVPLDTMPLTPNGKVDRRALPDPLGQSIGTHENQVLPRTPNERLIAEIWHEMLGVDHVSVQDNFFDLGGHSLSSMRAIARMNEALGLRLNPRVMATDTLEQIAADCERSGDPAADADGDEVRTATELAGAR